MDGEELGGTFVIAVEELGITGLWTTIRELLESRSPLQGLTLPNRLGEQVAIGALPLVYVLSNDKRVLTLKQYSHSPVTWFRNPITHLILVSTADMSEYRLTVKPQLKKVTADIERDWGAAAGCEWLILYVRPFELDPNDKGAKKVMEKLIDDFGSKKRERVVRLDVSLRTFSTAATGGGSSTAAGGSAGGLQRAGLLPVPGVSEYCAALRDSVRACFEVRADAYAAEVRKLLNERREPNWSFTTLYLVKDSGALLREGAGLWEDAFNEYVELETCYVDTLQQLKATVGADGQDFGVSADSEDASTLLSANWRTMRRLVLWKKAVPEYPFRQYLFAAQARVLLRLGRPLEVAERGLNFIQNFLELLAQREAAGHLRPWFKECWAFSACMSVISAITGHTARHGLMPAGRLPQAAIPGEWDAGELPWQGPASKAAQTALRTLLQQQGVPPPGTPGKAAAGASSGSSGAAAGTGRPPLDNASKGGPPPYLPADSWELGLPVNEGEVPKLDLEFLGGQAITPTMLSLVGLGGQQHGELLERLYHCLLGHLYHLARGQLLRLGSARGLGGPSTTSTAADVLQLNKDPGTLLAQPGAGSRAVAAAALRGSPAAAKPGAGGAGGAGSGWKSDGAALVAAAVASGTLSPTLVAACQELLAVPLCAYSCLVAKVADGVAGAHAYDVQTPRRAPDEDPLAMALSRTDSLSSPFHHQPGSGGSSSSSNLARGSQTGGGSPLSNKASMFDRLLRSGGTSPSSSQGGATAFSAGAAGGMTSRLSRATVELATDATSGSEPQLQRAASTVSLSSIGGAAAVVDITEESGVSSVPLSAAASPRAPGNSSGGASAAAAAAGGGEAGAGGAASPAAAAAAAPPAIAPGSLHARTQSEVLTCGTAPTAATAAPAASAPPGSAAPAGVPPNLRPVHLRSASEVPQSLSRSGAPGNLAAARGAAIGPLSVPPAGVGGLGGPLMSPAAAAAAAVLPMRASEWRLKLALSNSSSFEALVVALCRCAAGCYTKCGRVRSAALIYVDVAVLLLQQGDMGGACRLLDALLHTFIVEGWQLLLGRLLPKVLACQRLAASALLPYTAIRILGLPGALVPQQYREAAFQELCAAVGVDPAAAALPCNSCSSGQDGSSSRLAGPLTCLGALQLLPLPGSCSSFYGTEDTQGRPVLVPPARPYWCTASSTGPDGSTPGGSSSSGVSGGKRGAAVVAAGDLLLLSVLVVSNLPQAVAVSGVSLTLAQLQKASWVSAALSTASMLGSSGSLMATRTTSGSSTVLESLAAGSTGTARGLGGVGGGSEPSTPLSQSLKWQEVEELVANRLVAVSHDSSSSSSRKNKQAQEAADEGGGQKAVVAAAAAAGKGGWVVLQPGVNTLTFEVAPHQQGLYCLKHLDVVLGSTTLRVALGPPPSLPHHLSSSSSIRSTALSKSKSRSGGQDLFAPLPQLPTVSAASVTPLGSCSTEGTLEHLVVMAEVLPTSSRVAVQAVLPGCSLLVGQPGWVGLLLVPSGGAVGKPWLQVAAGQQLGFKGGAGVGASMSDGGVRSSQGGQLPQVASEGAWNSLASSMDFSGAVTAASAAAVLPGGNTLGSSSLPAALYLVPASAADAGQQLQPPAAIGRGSSAVAAAVEPGAVPGSTNGSSSSSPAPVGAEGLWVPTGRGGIDLAAAVAAWSTAAAPGSEAAGGGGAAAGVGPASLGAEGVLAAPWLVWIPVVAGCPSRAPEQVPVLPWDAPRDHLLHQQHHHHHHHQQHQQHQQLGGFSSSSGGQGLSSSSGLARKNSSCIRGPATDPDFDPDMCAELLVQLQFNVGMWRAHSQVLLLPLTQPFRVGSRAVALPHGQLALELTLTAHDSCSVVVKDISLVPQLGLQLTEQSKALTGTLPLLLQPGAAAGLTFLLARSEEGGMASAFKSDASCSMVQLHYSAHRATAEQAIPDPTSGTPLPPPPSSCPPASLLSLPSNSNVGMRLSGMGPSMEQLLPSNSSTSGGSGGNPRPVERASDLAACDSVGNLASVPLLTHTYCFTLNFPHVADDEDPQLSLLLLGPITGRVGQPLCLTWQIRRLQPQVPLAAHGDFATLQQQQQQVEVLPTNGRGLPPVGSSTSSWRLGTQGDGSVLDDTLPEETLLYEVLYDPDQADAAGGRRSPSPGPGGGRSSPSPLAVAAAPDGSSAVEAAMGWDQRWHASGSIRLGRAPGSLAVIETVVVPKVPGQLLPPRLVVHGMAGRHGVPVLAGDSGEGNPELQSITVTMS